MCRFLLQVLGLWLLLSQPCRARVSDEWLDEVIQVCGREYVRTVIEICGKSSGRTARSLQKPLAEIAPYFMDEDTELLDMASGFIPNLPQEQKATLSERQPPLLEFQQYAPAPKDSVSTFKEFKNIHNRKGEGHISPPGIKYPRFDAHSRKKRYSGTLLSHQCCTLGCTRRSIAAKFC